MELKNHALFLLLLFIICSFYAKAQHAVSGIVLNRSNLNPVNYATVYINGTTIGTSTDEKGFFDIPNVSAPCQLVVSRVGFEPFFLSVDTVSTQAKKILLREKSTQLSAVTVTGISNRKEYVAKFKEEFLGTDHWGQKAILMNDSALIFSPTNDSVVSTSKFSVKANEPIIVDLPLLGYRVFVNLIDFSFREKSKYNAECHYKGAYYFKAYEKVGVKQIENREMAYLNSSKHFLSALYNDKLKENGYLSIRALYNDSTRKTQFCYDDLNMFCYEKDATGIQIQGQNKIRITLCYFANAKGKPVNLTEVVNKRKAIDADLGDWMRTFSRYSKKLITVVYFLEDDCTIRSNGTIPDSNIKFFGTISKKRVGAKLPGDYEPDL